MRILLIEDDQELCHVLKISLEKAGYQTDICLTGTDALYYALQPVYNLIILDRMLPGMDGLSLLKLIRSSDITTPVILATAIDAVPERIAGLDCGADDYIVKPYDIEELMARIRALIRRPKPMEDHQNMEYGDLTYHTATLKLTCGAQTQQLSRRESMLMEYFLQNPDQTISRQMLYSRVWGPDGEVEDGNLDTYIYYLRKILKKLKSRVKVTTAHGIGYRLECPPC